MGPSPKAVFLSDIHQIASGVDAKVAVLSVLGNRKSRAFAYPARATVGVDRPRRAERQRFACVGMGERIAKPAATASGLPHSFNTTRCSRLLCLLAPSRLQQVHPRSDEIIEHRETPVMSDDPRIPGVASAVRKPMTFGEGTGDPYLDSQRAKKSRQALLDNRMGRSA
jgi:hypothetical protein